MDDPESRFTALYDAHYRGVLGYALTKAEPGTAKDVVSQVFLIAWRRIGAAKRFPGCSASPATCCASNVRADTGTGRSRTGSSR